MCLTPAAPVKAAPSALDRRELVIQDSSRGKFRLGVRLAGAAGRGLDVVQEGRPVCRALAQEAGETVNRNPVRQLARPAGPAGA